MKPLAVTVALLGGLCVSLIPSAYAAEGHTFVAASDLQWTDVPALPPGAKIANPNIGRLMQSEVKVIDEPHLPFSTLQWQRLGRSRGPQPAGKSLERRLRGHLGDAALPRLFLAGHDHARLQEHVLEHHPVLMQRPEDLVQHRLRHLRAALDRVVAVEQHLALRMRVDPETTYDGGVLEIKIGTAQFADVVTAGGTFLTGGYNHTIDAATDNALGSRPAWSGASGGFIATTVKLPAAAAGKAVQFKWRLGTDTANGYGGSGWYLDSIAVTDGYACCSFNPHIAPVISSNSFKISQTNVSLTVTSVLGGTYTLEYKNNLLDPAWTPLLPSVSGTGGPILLQDTNGPTLPSRFYRVNLQ